MVKNEEIVWWYVDVSVEEQCEIDISVSELEEVKIDIDDLVSQSPPHPDEFYEFYNGPYDVKPKIEEQTLFTKEKSMKDNITVLSIPSYEVSNQDGTTFVIGG